MPNSFPSTLPRPFDTLYFEVLEHLGSNEDNHRIQLRQAVATALKTQQLSPPTGLSDLSSPLQHDSFHLSLTHTADISAFAWVPKPGKIGIDIEILERIQPPVIRRVSSPIEIQSAPDMRFLWPAKEAVFKAHSHQLQVVGDIYIDNWKQLSEQMWQFSARRSHTDQILDGSGIVCLTLRHILSFFTFKG